MQSDKMIKLRAILSRKKRLTFTFNRSEKKRFNKRVEKGLIQFEID